jgi:hypothetical protein
MVAASAADLKFLQHLQQLLQELPIVAARA